MFLQKVWGKAVESRNGFADRFLIYCSGREDVSIAEKEHFSNRLDELPITPLDSIYEKIYAEHNTSERTEYKLNQSAKECYQKFLEDSMEKSDAKVDKNALKLALVLHVFYDRLKKALDTTVGTTERVITDRTMKMAISLCDTLSHVKTLMDLVSYFILICQVVLHFSLLYFFRYTQSKRVSVKTCTALWFGWYVYFMFVFMYSKQKFPHSPYKGLVGLTPSLCNENASLESQWQVYDRKYNQKSQRICSWQIENWYCMQQVVV